MSVYHARSSPDAGISPSDLGGLGTAVGGLATASAHVGISDGVMLVGGALVLGDGSYGAWKPISQEQRGLVADESLVVNSGGVFFFQVAMAEYRQKNAGCLFGDCEYQGMRCYSHSGIGAGDWEVLGFPGWLVSIV